MAKVQRWIGWHFLPTDGYTRWNCTKVRINQVLRETRPLSMCKCGLHASGGVLDALSYAPGSIACLVELRGERLDDTDKSCAAERKCLGKVDAGRILHEFAVWCARRALRGERKAGREPAQSLYDAVRTKERWLEGKATDDELAAAESAAWDAAAGAARGAVGGAAGRAASIAAESAAWNAALSAAWSAERSAAGSMARSTERHAQAKRLERTLLAAMGRRKDGSKTTKE